MVPVGAADANISVYVHGQRIEWRRAYRAILGKAYPCHSFAISSNYLGRLFSHGHKVLDGHRVGYGRESSEKLPLFLIG